MSPVFSGAKFHGPALSIITQFYFSVSGEEDRSSTDQQIMQGGTVKAILSQSISVIFSSFFKLFPHLLIAPKMLTAICHSP